MITKLYVDNLAAATTESDLRDLFIPHGRVAEVNVPTNGTTGRSRGFGWDNLRLETDNELLMKRITVRTTFCAQSNCAESTFERRFFWRGLYRHAVPLAILIQCFSPMFFRDDRAFIHYVGGDAGLGELHEDIDRFEYGNRVRQHWLRTGLRIRVNSARIAALAGQCVAG